MNSKLCVQVLDINVRCGHIIQCVGVFVHKVLLALAVALCEMSLFIMSRTSSSSSSFFFLFCRFRNKALFCFCEPYNRTAGESNNNVYSFGLALTISWLGSREI